MKIRKIHAENYKTYKNLDLNLDVTEDRPIILVGGANGCGKTTLFDAIYHALYGLEIKGPKQFEELFNAGVKNEKGMDGKSIVLEVLFTGMVLNQELQYNLKRTYILIDDNVRESVTLNMGGNQFTYGSATPQSQRATSEEIVNKVIAANLPAELSNYFLFDAMKTSDLVKEEQINKLIMKNINSVMGFNKYGQLRKCAETMLAEKKAERLENENQRKEYSNLTSDKQKKEDELKHLTDEYTNALNYANDNKTQYELLKEGRNADDVTRDKIKQVEESLENFYKSESQYRQDADTLVKDLETQVIFPKLASIIRTEVEVIVNAKNEATSSNVNTIPDSQLETITQNLVKLIEQRYLESGRIDIPALVADLKYILEKDNAVEDKFAFLSTSEVELLQEIVKSSVNNPFVGISEQRERLNNELSDLPNRRERLAEYRRMLNGTDYSIIEIYERNSNKINELKSAIEEKKEEIKQLESKIAKYDYDIPQVPDPQYDMLCKLPDFFKDLSVRLLRAKKASIERMMRDQLNINLVVYAGVIGRVELSANNSDDISFKIYHKNGNEIYLSQLNAGAKQTVMQVLLKVLYNLGDYEPPVMIDTVMGVLDKESREVILERYFPDLAHQTILLSTDTEITTERDFEKIQAYVAKTYTLHRDKENQCTTISEDYFGLQTKDY